MRRLPSVALVARVLVARVLVARVLLAVVATPGVASLGSAQMPKSISKPIETARKNAAATDAHTRTVEQAGKPAPAMPAPAKAAQAKPAPAKPAPARAAQAAAAPAPAASTPDVAQDSSKLTFYREVFTYARGGRRDPFASPIETGEIRPLLADLRVTGIIYDPRGRSSVAVMRDMSTQQQYRVKTGSVLGRARVAQIRPAEVVMTIDEYGFSRQEILKLAVQKNQQTTRTP